MERSSRPLSRSSSQSSSQSSSRPPSRSRSRTLKKKSKDQQIKQMQKKIIELESKLNKLSNQVNGNIKSIRKDMLKTNDDITDLEIGEGRNTRNIQVIKKEIQNLVDHDIEWEEKYGKINLELR